LLALSITLQRCRPFRLARPPISSPGTPRSEPARSDGANLLFGDWAIQKHAGGSYAESDSHASHDDVFHFQLQSISRRGSRLWGHAFFVALASVLDLLHRAKHLLDAAMAAIAGSVGFF
jgi:hypothetical protein